MVRPIPSPPCDRSSDWSPWLKSRNISGSFSASNLTDVVVRQTQQQAIGDMPRAWFEPGRSFRLQLRYTY